MKDSSGKKLSKRISKDQYYLNIAREVGKRGTCLRRNFGAVIVKADQIISTGYTGSPRETVNCTEVGKCFREALGIKKGEKYELCRGVHAEQNAIIHAPRLDMIEATLYLVGREAQTETIMEDAKSCKMCRRIIINSGIKRVVIQIGEDKIKEEKVENWVINNLGEIEKDGDQYKPIMQTGY